MEPDAFCLAIGVDQIRHQKRMEEWIPAAVPVFSIIGAWLPGCKRELQGPEDSRIQLTGLDEIGSQTSLEGQKSEPQPKGVVDLCKASTRSGLWRRICYSQSALRTSST